jgi:hypothetical protein
MLATNAEAYYASEADATHGVAYTDYCDAFDLVRGWLSLLDDIADDFRVEEPVKNLKPTYAYKIASAAQWRADLLRSRLTTDGLEEGGLPAGELVTLAKRIESLERFADYAEATGQMYDQTRGDEDE